MRAGSLSVYPLKASRGVQVDTAEVELCGLVDDRRWAVVDTNGKVVTARENDRILQGSARAERGALALDAPVLEPPRVPTPVEGLRISVTVSPMPQAIDAGHEPAPCRSQTLRQAVRSVWQEEPRTRTVSAQHGGVEGDYLNLADAGPLLLTATSSLDQLNAWIATRDPAAKAPMERFQPNIVVEGSREASEEDTWRRVSIADVAYRHAEICDRCVPTIDPVTLARHRRWDRKTWFGVRLIPLGRGTVRAGEHISGR
ncbi:MAG: MOSC N-terminal beta barrel domain-containing protein [Dermatophilaceae bacterium]